MGYKTQVNVYEMFRNEVCDLIGFTENLSVVWCLDKCIKKIIKT